MRTDRIILVGMPGSGKSTIGKWLAGELTLPFYDLDEQIERRQGKSIATIFKKDGESHFRKLEKKELEELIQRQNKMVLSTGGGTPCFFDNNKYIFENGTVIFLDPARSIIVERLAKNSDRPLVQGQNLKEYVEKLYSDRLPYYKKAHLRIANNPKDELRKFIKSIV